MKKNIFAVCDTEEEYARNFIDYLNGKRNVPFEVHAFTSAQALLAFAREKAVELLLISDKAMCSEIRELDIGKIIILSEEFHSPEKDSYSRVYKYQASSDVIREVMACYGEEKAVQPAVFPVLKKTAEILGVYSPIGRCLKTSFALTLGQILAQEREVLYISMEEYSGLEELLGKGFNQDLSHLLYYAGQENQNLILRMNGMIQTVNKLDFIPPVHTPADIRGTAWEIWNRLFNEIICHSSYEVIVLDIGNGIEENFQLLDKCKRIYMPVLKDVMSSCKIEQFENLLRVWDYSQVLAKTTKVFLPFHAGGMSTEGYIEQLVWSGLGDYVRELLRKEGK